MVALTAVCKYYGDGCFFPGNLSYSSTLSPAQGLTIRSIKGCKCGKDVFPWLLTGYRIPSFIFGSTHNTTKSN